MICWLRRDLRLNDNAALEAATREGPTLVLFVLDTQILDALPDKDDARVSFIFEALTDLDSQLRALGSTLIVYRGDPVEVVPRLAGLTGCKTVFAGRDYEPYARDRDAQVATKLARIGVDLQLIRDHVVFEPGELLSQSGSPYSVYTPFQRAWKTNFEATRLQERRPDFSNLMSSADCRRYAEEWSIESVGFRRVEPWLRGGEAAGVQALDRFRSMIGSYGELRDYPSEEATSVLSPYLRFGCVSLSSAFRLAMECRSEDETWLNELIWREFYQHVLFHWPHVAERAFRPEFESLDWPGLDEHFDAWKEGRTGYPIVDASMRCLEATGWLHNRLRMVVASFLTKDLMVDYRKGEAHFARLLLDFELASNNGGWQWCASTGCDAQPYFRIFNPWLQSVKFDSKGEFIKRWVPELAGFSDKLVHAPHEAGRFDQEAAGCVIGVDYPEPVVDHRTQTKLAQAMFASASKNK